jgi:gluconate 5-dehydrogenase
MPRPASLAARVDAVHSRPPDHDRTSQELPMPQNLFSLAGKVALVTGAYRGLGLAIARSLGRAGATVVLNGRKPDLLEKAAAGLADEGVRCGVAVFDVTDPDAIGRGVADARARHGPIDVLVNNAGIQRRHSFGEFPLSDWNALIATNLTAPFLVSQAVLPGMIERKGGKIIHIASLMSELARPTVVPYTATKGGVRQLTRGMAVELAGANVQVNAIAPGYFATEMNRALIDNAEFNAWVCKRTPAGRWGDPDEIGGVAVFLASAAANYITGQMIVIDGGMSVAL